ncbi:MAG: hypothetical protein PHZ28_04420 [Candidatus Izemoplasmatales bacterium]|nr:hypothetical protein [Candidatus Izemoplasmatales bacterium]
MIARKLGFDLKNIDYGLIKKRNNTAIFVLGLLFSIFFWVFISFVILWLMKIPFEINGVTRESSEIEYHNFMMTFTAVFGAFLLIFLIGFIIGLSKKPKDFIVISKDINLNKIYLIHYKKNRDAIIIGDSLFLYNRFTNGYEIIKNIEKINELKSKYLFWERWEDIEKYKITDKAKKTILKFKIEDGGIVFKYRYSFNKSSSNIPFKISESVEKIASRNNIGTNFNTYYFYDINRKNDLKLPEVVAKVLAADY